MSLEKKENKPKVTKLTNGKFKGEVKTPFKVKGLSYVIKETYYTNDEGSFNYLLLTRKIKKIK